MARVTGISDTTIGRIWKEHGLKPHLVRTGKAQHLTDEQVEALCAQVPGTTVHRDLAAFAEHMVQTERRDRTAAGESDSGFGRLD